MDAKSGFWSDETATVVSVMRQLARLQLEEDEVVHNYFIRARELSMGSNLRDNIYQNFC